MEKLDLSKILRQCPIGTPLYSTAYGTVTLVGLNNNTLYAITVKLETGYKAHFNKDGSLAGSQEDAECTLFPSYNQRDWSLFKVPKSKTSITLHPFDRVLVRDFDNEIWRTGILSHIKNDPNDDYHFVTTNEGWMCCVPYNENTADLLGTTDAPDEEYEISFSKDFNVI